jgi:DNA-binding NtrC family response regulator
MFGHVRGAFTGAVVSRRGLLEQARGGTIFLDEIGDLDPCAQAKLLRFLDSGEYRPLGARRPMRSRARIIAATNRDIERASSSGKFRADLLHRLAMIRLTVPPLRERPGDIPVLVEHFLAGIRGLRGGAPSVSREALGVLTGYGWPGNVRELHGELIGAAVRAGDGAIGVYHLSERLLDTLLRPGAGSHRGLRERLRLLERAEIVRALAAARGNRSSAAAMLGLKRTTLLEKMRRHGIDAYRDRAPHDASSDPVE